MTNVNTLSMTCPRDVQDFHDTLSMTYHETSRTYIIVRISHLYVAIYMSLLLYMQIVLLIGRHFHSRYLLDCLA
jgi:hypothetical protein